MTSADCTCQAISVDFDLRKVSLGLVSLPAYATSFQVSISAWNSAYGQEPIDPQITIIMSLLKCSDQRF